eukprot:scaffold375_cov378-Prasinococcus_capsulatus_cf.AAC.7
MSVLACLVYLDVTVRTASDKALSLRIEGNASGARQVRMRDVLQLWHGVSHEPQAVTLFLTGRAGPHLASAAPHHHTAARAAPKHPPGESSCTATLRRRRSALALRRRPPSG